jgi:hypothetical protein
MTRRRLDGRIAVVTSSGKGVGGAVAGRLAADGAAAAPGPIAVWEKGDRSNTYTPEMWKVQGHSTSFGRRRSRRLSRCRRLRCQLCHRRIPHRRWRLPDHAFGYVRRIRLKSLLAGPQL